jgi:hypothetical protein
VGGQAQVKALDRERAFHSLAKILYQVKTMPCGQNIQMR